MIRHQPKAFYCHMGDKPLCHGWYAARFGSGGKETQAPWPFSDDIEFACRIPESPA